MQRLERANAPVSFTFEGSEITAQEGDSVAAALIAAGQRTLRSTAASGAPRGPLCLMGVCFDCLVEIDGKPNQQACLTKVRAGMSVRRQQGAPDIAGAGP